VGRRLIEKTPAEDTSHEGELFELPSNLILQRVGARLWIARIMFVWGVISAGMMFAHSTTAFYVMRFLLGVAEAGFFPGILPYFLLNVGGYGYEFWLPTILKGFSGQSNFVVGLINAVPYCAATVVMVAVGRHSDRTGERRWHLALAALASAAGFTGSAVFQDPLLAIAALTLAFVGLKSALGPFWALGTTFLSGTAAAGGIAWINSVGNLGGFVGPTLVGLIRDATGSNVAALLVLGGVMLAMGRPDRTRTCPSSMLLTRRKTV
jgi:MFS family permease